MHNLNSMVQMLKAAGEITRLRLLALLSHGELSVKDMTQILDQSQPRISRHLKLLSDAGIVERHAEGAWAYFALVGQGDAAGLVQNLIAELDFDDAQLGADAAQLKSLRDQQRQQAADYFAGVAQDWDALRGLHVPEAAVEAAIARHAKSPAHLLIDLGTGTGRMLELLAPHYKQGIGIDSSREMMAVARAKLSDAGISHGHIRHGDIVDLGDYAGQADRIIIHQVLHYFDDPGIILKSATQALNASGEMLIVDFAPHNLEFLRDEHAHRRLGLSQDQMRIWAQAAGLHVARFEDFPHGEGADGLTVCLWVLKNQSNNNEVKTQ